MINPLSLDCQQRLRRPLPQRVVVLACLHFIGLLQGALLPVMAETPERQTAPTAKEIQAVRETIDAIYRTPLAEAKTPKQRAALARTILGDSSATKNPAERYVMLGLAVTAATEGDDAMLLLSLCETMATEFGLDRTSLLAERLAKSSADPTVESRAQWFDIVRKEFEAAIAADRFDDADSLLTALATRARKGGDAKVQAAVTSLRKRVSLQRKRGAELEQLRKAAERPDATAKDLEKLGRYECFIRSNWPAGLPLLVKGDDTELAAAARLEMAQRPEADAKTCITVADAWARCDAKATPAEQAAILNHSLDLFLLVLPRLEGLEKVRVQRSVEALQKELAGKAGGKGGWITVFRSSDSTIWNTDTAETPNKYAVALNSLPDGIRYVRIRRASGQAVVLPITSKDLSSAARGERLGWQGGKPDVYKAILLGIFDTSKNLMNQPGVFVFVHGTECFSGYGFGHQSQTVGPAVAVWDSKPIPGEVLEISVTSNHLTPQEQESLLR